MKHKTEDYKISAVKYYINIDENIILKQKFLRQVDKLYERKEWFINTFLENKKNEKFIREKNFKIF